jgi:anti-sigma B factor antagonist
MPGNPSTAKLEIKEEGTVTVATFLEASMLDATSIEGLGNQLEKAIKERPQIKLVIDLSNVDYVCSAVLGRLVKIFKIVKDNKGKMKLAGIKSNILHVFKITKLDKMFEILPTRKKAVDSFSSFKLFF